jgi:hypothetical protein
MSLSIGNTTNTVSGTAPLAIFIDRSGNLVSLENVLGTTYMTYYVRSGAGWLWSGVFFSLGSYAVAHLTMDHLGTFWAIGYGAGSMVLWSYTLGLTPTQRAGPFSLQPGEVPSWITAERPDAASVYPQGLIWVTTHDPTTQCTIPIQGRNLWVFDPQTPTNPICGMQLPQVPNLGGDQIWPDTTSSSGTGVWVIQNNPGTGNDQYIRVRVIGGTCPSFTACSALTTITADFNPGGFQMDKNILGTSMDKAVWSRAFGMGAGYSEYIQTPPGNPPPYCVTALGSCNGPQQGSGVLAADIRGTGWSFAEYILTGTITGY